jgi:hypothetical protein
MLLALERGDVRAKIFKRHPLHVLHDVPFCFGNIQPEVPIDNIIAMYEAYMIMPLTDLFEPETLK